MVCGFGPWQGFGVFVVDLEVAVDRFLQPPGAAMGAAPDLLFRQQREPAPDEVRPRCIRRRDAKVAPGMLGQPLAVLRVL